MNKNQKPSIQVQRRRPGSVSARRHLPASANPRAVRLEECPAAHLVGCPVAPLADYPEASHPSAVWGACLASLPCFSWGSSLLGSAV